MSNRKSVCIIGGGASGLVSVKCCLDAKLIVTCYEQSDDIGGLWKYRDDDVDGMASVARSTIINSSKEISAFSDYPPSPEYANYMHNSQMFAYFNDYANYYHLRKYITFNCKVMKVERNTDYFETGKWKVSIVNNQTNETDVRVFDGVMVCTGHHVKPLIPTFKGQDKFQGRIIHSHSYKKPAPFDGQKVVVVGIGNSGGDVAVELSIVAKKVYHSFRKGAWTIWRVGTKGLPMDAQFLRKYALWMDNFIPLKAKDWSMQFMANRKFDHDLYRIKPAHGVFSQHVYVNDSYPNRILSGTISVKRGIKEFTESGVIFDDENEETECDTVILATGYEISFPFLEKSVIWSDNNEISLYKYTFSPSLHHPGTLAIIGFIQPIGPLIPISEMQARWFVEVLRGARKLPSKQEMLKDICKKRDNMKKRYYQSTRHQIQVDYAYFMDELAIQVGVKPDLISTFFQEPILWYHLVFGPYLPYQFRLRGSFPWPGAKKAILEYSKRVAAPFQTRTPDKGADSTKLTLILQGILFIIILTIFSLFAP